MQSGNKRTTGFWSEPHFEGITLYSLLTQSPAFYYNVGDHTMPVSVLEKK